MAKNIVLETLLENYKVTIPEVASELNISSEELELIVLGKLPMTIDHAKKLGEHFNIQGEIFFKEQAETTHLNLGDASNSNSGYIGTYSNDQNKVAVELLTRLNDELKGQIAEIKEHNKGKKKWWAF